MRISLIGLLSLPLFGYAQFSGMDNFDDNSLDIVRWAPQSAVGNASWQESNENLEFNTQGNGAEFQYLFWGNASYDEDFEIIFRTTNTSMPEGFTEFGGIGLEIYPAGSATTRLNVRHGSYWVSNFGPSRDILANFFTGAVATPTFPVQPLTIFPKNAAIRVAFSSATKVFTVYYDDLPTDGVQWTQLSTFGVSSAANGVHNVNFGLSSGGFFDVYVYARTDSLDADFGDMTLDDFQAFAGGVTSPAPQTATASVVEFQTRLGDTYSVLKSTDLSAQPAFTAVALSGAGDTYRVVPAGEGVAQITGTGNPVRILDPTTDQNEAFYKLVRQ